MSANRSPVALVVIAILGLIAWFYITSSVLEPFEPLDEEPVRNLPRPYAPTSRPTTTKPQATTRPAEQTPASTAPEPAPSIPEPEPMLGLAPDDPANAAFWYLELAALLTTAPEEFGDALTAAAAGEVTALDPHATLWKDILEKTDAATACEACEWPGITPDTVDFTTELPELGPARQAAEALTADAWRAHGSGRTLDALSRLDQAGEIAADLEGMGLLISNLVATSIRDRAMLQMRRLLLEADDPALYERAIELLARQEATRKPIAQTFAMEMAAIRNTIGRMREGDEAALEIAAEAGIEVPLTPESRNEMLQSVNVLDSHLLTVGRILRAPLPQAIRILQNLHPRIAERAQALPLLGVLLPNVPGLVLAQGKAISNLRAMRIWSAVHLYRHRNGRLPETLAEVDSVLSGLPSDPLSGEAPGYRVDGDEFLLWMVGENLVDDGGNPTLDLTLGGR